jgi:hypothetical protein
VKSTGTVLSKRRAVANHPVDMLFWLANSYLVMAPSDRLSEEKVRAIVRDELIGTSRTLTGTVFWTILSLFAVLVGLQLFQLALYATSILAIVGFVLAGTLVTGSSLYLLYLLHWV